MNCCWCTIATGRLEESIRFYTELVGLTVARRFSPAPGTEIAFLKDANGFEVELLHHAASERGISERNAPADSPKEGISLGFEVESLEQTLAAAKRYGAAPFGSAKVPGCSFFFVKDPNGVSVQFVQNER